MELTIVTNEDGKENMQINSLYEFQLGKPALSIAVLKAARKTFRPYSPSERNADRFADDDYDEHKVVGIQAVLYEINPKHFRELELRVELVKSDLNDSIVTSASFRDDFLNDTPKPPPPEVTNSFLLNAQSSFPEVAAGATVSSVTSSNGSSGSAAFHSPLENNDISDALLLPSHSLGTDTKRPSTPPQPSELFKQGGHQRKSSPNSAEVSHILKQASDDDDDDEDDDDDINTKFEAMGIKVDELARDIESNGYSEDVSKFNERPHTPVAVELDRGGSSSNNNGSGDGGGNNYNPLLSETVFGELKQTLAGLRQASQHLVSIKSEENNADSNARMCFQRQEEQLQDQGFVIKDISSKLQEALVAVRDQKLAYDDLVTIVAKNEATTLSVGRQDMNSNLQFSAQLQSVVHDSLHSAVSNMMSAEVKQTVADELRVSMESIENKIQSTITSKLTSMDAMVKDHVARLIKSKTVTDSLGNAAWSAVSGEFQAKYKDAFHKHVVPSFESSTKKLFEQLNESFSRGTKEYVDEMRKQAQMVQQSQDESIKALVDKINKQSDATQVKIDQQLNSAFNSVSGKLQQQMTDSFISFRQVLLEEIKAVVRDEVGNVMRDQQQQLLRSTAPTPSLVASVVDHKDKIVQLINQKRYNDAFQLALSASDLSLLIFTCSKVNPQLIFTTTPIGLKQEVLLSLVQQLATDLYTHTELKIRYLEEAVLALDKGHLKSHLPTVMIAVDAKISSYLRENPAGTQSRSLKMLQMVANGLVNQ